jgi:predicted nucleic acid-binding protein
VRVYLDSCVLIYLVEGPPGLQQRVATAIRGSAQDLLCMSDLVRMECLVGPLRSGDEPLLAMYRERMAQLLVLPMVAPVFELAAQLRARHRLRTPDALHAAAALHHGCEELWTGDRRFAAVEDRIRVRIFEETP